MSGWGYALMTLNMVLFWALVIFGVVTLVRYLPRGERTTAARPTPEQVLAERFARGDINEGCREGCCHQPQISTFPLLESFCPVDGAESTRLVLVG